MKNIPSLLAGAMLTAALAGCSTPTVVLAPVGPNPSGGGTLAATGQLEVFSATSGHTEGDNPTWYQHTDYYLLNKNGKELKHVDNNLGRYATAPRLISLAPGRYLVKAKAKDYLWVKVPVVVKAGETTRVHLDENWRTPGNVSQSELVKIPGGYPIGWSTSIAKQ